MMAEILNDKERISIFINALIEWQNMPEDAKSSVINFINTILLDMEISGQYGSVNEKALKCAKEILSSAHRPNQNLMDHIPHTNC